MITTEENNKRKEIEIEWNGQKGKLVLVADLKAGQLERIRKNCINLDRGMSIDAFDAEEYVVQMAQQLVKEAPKDFAIDRPDNFRNLDPETWGKIQDFIGEHYPVLPFLSHHLKMLFGTSWKEQNSMSSTTSTTIAGSS